MSDFEKGGCVGGGEGGGGADLVFLAVTCCNCGDDQKIISHHFHLRLFFHILSLSSLYSLLRVVFRLAFWLAEPNHAFSLQAYSPDGHAGHAAARVSSYSPELSQNLHL